MRIFIDYLITIQSDNTVNIVCDGDLKIGGKIDTEQMELAVSYIDALQDNVLAQKAAFQNFGKRLFGALFAEPIGGHFREQAWRKLLADSSHNTYIRIFINFQPGVHPTILSIPWEFLYYPEQDLFLGTHPRITISYSYDLWNIGSRKKHSISDQPLRVLFVHTHPKDLDGIGVIPVKNAIDELKKSNTSVSIKELKNPDLPSLRNAIEEYKPHVFHFLGHGEYQDNTGLFALLDHENNALWYDAQSFGDLFTGWHPNLVILHSCQSGSVSNYAPFSSGAEWLYKQNVPAVVGMRFPFSQGFGWTFVQEFYSSLANNDPIDLAVQLGRRALSQESLSGGSHINRDFGVPLVWMQPGFSFIFAEENKKTISSGQQLIHPKQESNDIVRNLTGQGFDLSDLVGTAKHIKKQGYLNRLRENVGYIRMSKIFPEKSDGMPLEDIYTPLPVNLTLGIEIKDKKVENWWITPSKDIANTISGKWDAQNKQSDSSVIDVIVGKTQGIIEGVAEDNSYERDRPLVLAPLWSDQIIEKYYILEAIDTVATFDRLVLLGAPGSGKSTFAKYLALSLIAPQLIPPVPDMKANRLQNWPHGLFTPIYVELRDFVLSSHYPKDLDDNVNADHFWDYVKDKFLKGDDEYAPALLDDLVHGRGIIILDGLDEVPIPLNIEAAEQKRRKQLKSLTRSLSTRFRSSRILITSRPHAYAGWKLDDFQTVTLVPLETEHKFRLATTLYAQAKDVSNLNAAQQQARALLDALDNVPISLTDRPLFITLLAILFLDNLLSGKKGLPTKRGALIDEHVRLLLGRWTESRRQEKSLLQHLGCTEAQLYEGLEKIAFRIQSKGGAGNDAPLIDLEIILGELFELGTHVNPHEVLAYMSQAAGILISPYQGAYKFAHRMFQEYLAASYLSRNQDFQAIKNLIENNFVIWREVGILIGDILSESKRRTQLWSLVDFLVGNIDDEDWHSVWLAARLLVDQQMYLDQQAPSQRDTQKRLKNKLKKLISIPQMLRPLERIEIGESLGVIGDDRPGVGVLSSGLPDIQWCVIPAGKFYMGTSPEQIELIQKEPWASGWLFEREIPGFELEIRSFSISKYPITQSQFKAFIDADDGYFNDQWWSTEGLKWRDKVDPNTQSHNLPPNSPRIEVRWHEARAFCDWLGNKLNKKIRIPTEPEWEKAARGNDNRIFPWGNKFISDFVNFSGVGIGRPSPVGCLIFENTPWGDDGPWDMVGNTWEWCTTICEKQAGIKYPYPYAPDDGREELEKPDEYMRILRGGCYSNSPFFVRVSYRGRDKPSVRLPYEGFRIVMELE
jgi:formylglycine-generating enzyme required for sulfatase activity